MQSACLLGVGKASDSCNGNTFRKGWEGVKGSGESFPQQREQCKSISKSAGQDPPKASLVTSSKAQKQGLSGYTGHAQELKVQRLKGPLMADWTWVSAHRECQSIFNRKGTQHVPGHAE